MWSLHKKMAIKKMNRIMINVTKMVPDLSDMMYEDRLREMELMALVQRKERADLIKLYISW